MSLEECKRLAEETLAKDKERQRERRQSIGRVDGENVWVFLRRHIWSRKPWVVTVYAYGETSDEDFDRKELADRYFEELTQKYGLEEEEK